MSSKPSSSVLVRYTEDAAKAKAELETSDELYPVTQQDVETNRQLPTNALIDTRVDTPGKPRVSMSGGRK